MAKSPPGGASTINGILYQMLYALATFGEISILNPLTSDEDSTKATVVLEPSDGGDQQIHLEQRRKVQQLKIRCDGEGTWSLREIIESVIPDLYRAVDFGKIETEFVLVTEGRRGRWDEVEDFFAGITAVTEVSQIQDQIDALDDSKKLAFRRSTTPPQGKTETFWGENQTTKIKYTQLKLFNRIAKELETKAEISDDPETIKQKLYYLLSRLSFEWNRSFENIHRLIREWVSQVIDAREEIDNRIGAMIAELQRIATLGDASIENEEFFAKFKLNALQLGDFERIRLKSETLHNAMLATRLVHLATDPRANYSSSFVSVVSFEKPHLMLVGDSGQGKSWLGHAIIAEALRQNHIAFAVASGANGQANLDVVGSHLWQRIIGHDNTTPYSNTVERLKEKIKWLPTRKLFVFLDGTMELDSLTETCFHEWENWNTTLILNCFPKTYEQLEDSIKRRFHKIEVPDFKDHEAKVFLGSTADVYSSLDEPVKQTIRRPFFAAIFRELATGREWGNEIEYQLYEEFWTEKLLVHTDSHDIEGLLHASFSVFEGSCDYPIEFSALCPVNDADTPKRLIKSKWVCKTVDGKYEFWHPRLLDWAIAKSILKKLEKNEVTEEVIVEKLGQIMSSGNVGFGFVPMDVMWLALNSGLVEFSLKLQLAFEGRR